ncbi:MAG: malate dehydrogenase, partial [Rhodospirillales bacterium]|nr:malate dehydrogenase [Rhodospirillales bacterium]
PNSSRGTSAIRAIGEHKGSGLAFMIELLAGALTGSGCSGPPPRPFANGMLSIYLKPEAFDRTGGFAAEVREYLRFFKGARPLKAGDEVLAPGEPELKVRALREAQGIPLAEEAWHNILIAAERVGLDRKALEKISEVTAK